MTGSSTLLEERIERSMARLGGGIEPGLVLDDIVSSRSGRGSHSAVGVAAASLVALAGVALWLTATDSEPPVAAPTTLAEVAPPTQPLYLPASLPQGFVLTNADRRSDNPTLNPTPSFVLAVPTETGGYRDPVLITLAERLITNDEVVWEHDAVELADGTSAELLRNDTNGQSLLQWTTGGGRAVVVWNEVVANQSNTEALLSAVANAVTISDSSLTVTGELPAGLEIVGTTPTAYPGTSAQLTYSNDGDLVFVTVTQDPPEGWQFLYMGDGLEPVQIGVRRGWISERQYLDGAEDHPPTRIVTWLAEPDIHIAVSGEGLNPEQLIAFAETLRPVDEATWDEAAAHVLTNTSTT